ncbi:pleckstrin homology domain-containing family F member 1 homolog [Diaphorina citri]|uniref:Pleckstrin homology domain-containing family F member 1 homolog n=1 Tax=Diaphorina citri TaxID=121845 RepID=A0A3Q0IZS1_DIACI|nr:pleckstrin homology domain-containing family F member 1 homolog [Diaphorina citri]
MVTYQRIGIRKQNQEFFPLTAEYLRPLNVQGRVLVGEGVLTKMCRKKPKARQFFLFNDILVYGNIIISKKKYNKQHIIPLEEVKLESLKDDGLGVSRCKQNLARWGYTEDDKCECGATQDEQHLLNCEQLENTCTHDDLKKANQRAVQVANFWKLKI